MLLTLLEKTVPAPQFSSWHGWALFAVAVLLLGSVVYFFCHYKHREWIRPQWIFTIAIGLAIFIQRLPLRWEEVKPLSAGVLSFLDVLRSFTMNVDFSKINLDQGSWGGNVYQWVDILLAVLAPLCTLQLLFSMLSRSLHRLGATMRFRREICYFSELNEKSLVLAKSIRDYAQKKPVIAFCQVGAEESQNRFLEEAKQIGATFYSAPLYSLHTPNPMRRKQRLFFIDTREENNMPAVLKMGKRLEARGWHADKEPKSDIYIFSTIESTELLFDRMLKRFQLSREIRQAYNFHLIDETKLIVQKLLLEHPLFEAVGKEESKISVLSVGGGHLGMEFVRSACVCGMMDSYQFDIRVIDKDADHLREQFLQRAPYFSDPTDPLKIGIGYAPQFYRADVTEAGFVEVLEKHCSECNYILVCTGDDERNISTAGFLRRWYAHRCIEKGLCARTSPVIITTIRDSGRYDALQSLDDLNLAFIGKNEEIFSASEVMERKIDASAALCNTCYDYGSRKLKPSRLCLAPEQRAEQLQGLFRLSCFKVLSNQLVALHGIYKLQDMFHKEGSEWNVMQYRSADTVIEGFLERACELLRSNRERLLELEHRRWMLFHLLDGWKQLPVEKIEECLERGLSGLDKLHQIPVLKLHGCLTPAEKLPELTRVLNIVRTKHGRSNEAADEFTHYDEAMCCAALFTWIDLALEETRAEALRSRLSSEDNIAAMHFPSYIQRKLNFRGA